MKIFPALFAAMVITVLVGAAMFIIGANALFNKNIVPITNSPQAVSAAANPSQANQPESEQQQIQQLQSLVQQYQQREKQYQAQINSAAQRLNQDNQQIQSYQQLLADLQQAGIIRITPDGQVIVPRQRFSGGDN
jgi:uncharacterized protein YlxW (UPF0749 family)